MGDVVVGFC